MLRVAFYGFFLLLLLSLAGRELPKIFKLFDGPSHDELEIVKRIKASPSPSLQLLEVPGVGVAFDNNESSFAAHLLDSAVTAATAGPNRIDVLAVRRT